MRTLFAHLFLVAGLLFLSLAVSGAVAAATGWGLAAACLLAWLILSPGTPWLGLIAGVLYWHG